MEKVLLTSVALWLMTLTCSTPQEGISKFPEGTPISYEYSYRGPMMYPMKWYKVTRTESGAIELKYQSDSPVVLVFRAPDDALERIGDIARSHRLHKLKRDYNTRYDIRDGRSWSLHLSWENYVSISSGGYMAWPRSEQREGIDAINEYLQAFVDSGPEVIRTEAQE